MKKKKTRKSHLRKIVYRKPEKIKTVLKSRPQIQPMTKGVGTFPADLTFFQSLRLQMDNNKVDKPYAQHIWVYACINAIAQNIAGVPFKLFKGKTEKPKEIEEGPVYNLFRDVNPNMSRYQLWEATMIYLGLPGGECLWLLEKDDPRDFKEIPRMIWPVSGRNFAPIIENKIFLGWEYRGGKMVETLEPAEVIQFKYFNPYDPFRGLSPISAAMLGIEQDWQASQYNKAFFENSADPGGILVYKPEQGGLPLTDKQKQELRSNWEDRHKGTSKARRVAILEGGMDYKPLAASHTEMQFLEQKKWNRDEIMAAYKVPKSELSVYEDLNYATALSQDKGFWNKTLIPKMKYIEDVLEAHLFKYIEGGEIWGFFDTTSIEALQKDFKEKILNAKELHAMGWPINAINKKLDLGFEDVTWGDDHFLPFSMVPAKSLVDAEPPASESPAEEEGAKESITKKQIDSLKYWDNYVAKILNPNEKKFHSKIKRYFFALRSDQLKRLEESEKAVSKLDSWELDDVLFAQDEWDKKLKATTRPLYENIMVMSGAELAAELGGLFQFDLTSPAMISFLNEKLIKVTKINATLREGLRKTLMEGINLKETIGELQDRVRSTFNMASNRSLTIARTETAMAASGTRFEAMKQEGIEKHRWITARDEAVRPSHVGNDGQVVRIGSPFRNGLRNPSDIKGSAGEVINCRCVAVAEIE